MPSTNEVVVMVGALAMEPLVHWRAEGLAREALSEEIWVPAEPAPFSTPSTSKPRLARASDTAASMSASSSATSTRAGIPTPFQIAGRVPREIRTFRSVRIGPGVRPRDTPLWAAYGM